MHPEQYPQPQPPRRHHEPMPNPCISDHGTVIRIVFDHRDPLIVNRAGQATTVTRCDDVLPGHAPLTAIRVARVDALNLTPGEVVPA